MLFSVVLPLMIGALGVLQNTFNRKYADTIGLPMALVVNNLVLLGLSIGLFWALRLVPEASLPEIFRHRSGFAFSPRYILPGLFGMLIITTAPWAIQRVGATRVFIGIIAAQIVVSLLWDYFEAEPVSGQRILGAALALAGALLAAR